VKVLVTGGRGFLGTYVSDALRAEGHEAIALGRVDGDLAEPGVAERLVAEHKPEAVVHLAAVMPGDERLAQNAPMTALVAAACGDVPLFLGSTVSVYTDETQYVASKQASEDAAPGATILRFSFPYGPRQRRGAILTMLKQARAGEPVVVYRRWVRSFCHAADQARAVASLVERRERGAWDIGRNDDQRTLLEIAQISCRLAGAPESLIDEVDPPAGVEPIGVELDLDRLHSLGWRPEIALEDGMQQTLDWLASPRT
jgi:nucleoside-diphosphate-sugar epimerase